MPDVRLEPLKVPLTLGVSGLEETLETASVSCRFFVFFWVHLFVPSVSVSNQKQEASNTGKKERKKGL